jgi:hypothetical protein
MYLHLAVLLTLAKVFSTLALGHFHRFALQVLPGKRQANGKHKLLQLPQYSTVGVSFND